MRQAAVEALAVAAGDRAAAMLEARCEDESPSVRAAAIRVLLMRRAPQAAQSLLKTLRHRDPEHRMAALSVVERLRLSVLEAHVTIIAGRDPDSRVRSRAARIMQTFGRAAAPAKAAVVSAG
ncbi:MAG: HEAT repeat domain-containing protein [Phycisphaerae bacterium]|nr:HEAT repeat domain-containing protein [Phycisphaerae bacterium]